MTKANEAVARYIAAWNENDPGRRRALVAETWSEAGSYRDPRFGAVGVEAISAMIGEVRSLFPAYRFRLASGIDAHHGSLRFRWEAGASEDAPYFFAGTDFAVLAEDGRFAAVTGFRDAAPDGV